MAAGVLSSTTTITMMLACKHDVHYYLAQSRGMVLSGQVA
jgi:hypothetical protein